MKKVRADKTGPVAYSTITGMQSAVPVLEKNDETGVTYLVGYNMKSSPSETWFKKVVPPRVVDMNR